MRYRATLTRLASQLGAAVAELLDSSHVTEWWPAARAALTPQEPR
jgi:hypothetical protein